MKGDRRSIIIGNHPQGISYGLDVDIVLTSNLLVQANSGGGKSWALRRMIEQIAKAGHVPQVVIDPEGEFSTLRQKFDFLLVGKGGDTPADVRSAALLARRILTWGVSAVIDLYEMPPTDRPRWIAAFLRALVDAPKDLWRDLLIYVDEAHEAAPEPGHGQRESSAQQDSRSAMIDVAARGRKRGFGIVAATQRLGKLSKDFAAELKNVAIGMTFLDIDRERAVTCLGIGRERRLEFMGQIKTLDPGNFWGIGRALTKEPTLFKTGEIVTEHPTPGRRQSAPPPPTAKIKHLLPQLADLPKEAEDALKTEAGLRARVATLEAEIAKAARAPAPDAAKTVTTVVEKPVIGDKAMKRIEVVAKQVEGIAATLLVKVGLLERERIALEKLAEPARTPTVVMGHAVRAPTPRAVPVTFPRGMARAIVGRGSEFTQQEIRVSAHARGTDGERSSLGKGEMQILTAVAQHYSSGVTREQLTVLTGYKRSSRDTYLQRLRAAGLVNDDGQVIASTPAGVATLGADFAPLPTGRALLDHWLRELTGGEHEILKMVAAEGGGSVARDLITEVTNYKRSSRDTYLQRLSARRLVDTTRDGVSLSRMLMD